MAKLDAGQLLARTLVEAGVHDVFALHGGHLDAFLQGCTQEGIRLIDVRHEATAGHAAEGYARTTGRIGVCTVTAGPGFTNAYTAIADAYLDSIPVLFITSSPPLRETEWNSLQGGFDQVAAALPVTKWAHRVTNGERLPDLVSLAMRKAFSGRPGPVLLDVPIDVMFRPIDERAITRPTVFAVNRPAPAPADVARLVELLQGAERPALVLGGGTLFPPCAEEVRRFADATNIPVFTTGKAHGMLPPDHASNFGGMGALGLASAMGMAPDLVILLGARQGMYTGGRGTATIPAGAKIVQVDIEPAEIGRIRPVDLPIAAGCQELLRALLAEPKSLPDFAGWRTKVRELLPVMQAAFASLPAKAESGRIHPFHALKSVFDAIGPEAIITSDGGESGVWAGQFFRTGVPGGVLTNGYLGTLGCGTGFAIGAQVAHPGRRVVQIAGDGAFGFHLQELDTMVRHNLPIVTVVANNTIWGMSTHGQEGIWGAGQTVAATLRDTDYDRVAVAFGGYGERVKNFEEVAPAVQRSLDANLAAVVNLEIAPDVVHPLMVQMMAPPADPTDIVIPYYENIPVFAD
ncbi:MAG: thiamine pyrophosphate-binding protein [Dehalococcoidia bacterium]|nr:thiamine pyrophosphate-binding protein [Dehalococcoidia bacterium]